MTIILEQGKIYKDRSDSKWEIVSQPNNVVSVGMRVSSGYRTVKLFITETGSRDDIENNNLVEEYVEPRFRYFNVYDPNNPELDYMIGHPSLEEANSKASTKRKFCVEVNMNNGDCRKVA